MQGVDLCVGKPIVGIDAQKWVARDQRQRLKQPAAGIAQQGTLIRNGQIKIGRMLRQVCLDLIGEIVDVDYDPPDPSGAQQIKHVIEQRGSSHF
jgi:hypothetical protein